MTHVVLKQHEGKIEFLVDGVDMTKHTYTEGFRIEFGEDLGFPVRVHCIIAADSLDAEWGGSLPASVVDAPRTEVVVGEGESAEHGFAIDIEVSA